MRIKLNIKIKKDIWIIFLNNKIWFSQKLIEKNKVLTFFFIFIILKNFGFIIKYK